VGVALGVGAKVVLHVAGNQHAKLVVGEPEKGVLVGDPEAGEPERGAGPGHPEKDKGKEENHNKTMINSLKHLTMETISCFMFISELFMLSE